MIIFLNGTSSSGKSSIAEQLLRVLPTPYFHLPVDAINSMRARERTYELDPDELADVLERTVLGFHRVVAGMAAAGNDVVVDHVLRERHWLLDCLTLLKDEEVVFVGVRCPLDEVVRRERERGDRRIGRAAYHFDRVHAHGRYDVECDTGVSTPEQCALRIKDFLDRGRSPSAFRELYTLQKLDDPLV
jgi:chloramphenicol 3-O phosphotransferase